MIRTERPRLAPPGLQTACGRGFAGLAAVRGRVCVPRSRTLCAGAALRGLQRSRAVFVSPGAAHFVQARLVGHSLWRIKTSYPLLSTLI